MDLRNSQDEAASRVANSRCVTNSALECFVSALLLVPANGRGFFDLDSNRFTAVIGHKYTRPVDSSKNEQSHHMTRVL